MTKVIELSGFFNFNSGYDFKDKNVWKGNAVLYDDGWFEGVVHDSKENGNNKSFVFGVCHEDKIIQMFKLSPVTAGIPFIYTGINNDFGYTGNFGAFGINGIVFCGFSHIKEKDKNDVDILDVLRDISIQKNKMSGISTAFYDGRLAMRDVICRTVLSNYESHLEKTGGIDYFCQITPENREDNEDTNVKSIVKSRKTNTVTEA